MPTRKAIRYSVNSNGTKLEQVGHTHRTSRRGGWPRGFGELNPSPHSWIFTSISGDSSSRFYLFTSATVRIAVHSTPKCGTEPIRYVTLHFLDGRGAARCSFTPLQKFRQNHRSHVWTEAVSNPVLFPCMYCFWFGVNIALIQYLYTLILSIY